ncbi:MAG: tRNA (adenosine(37)-N6)-threonylcarbamoyltransferase complex ATPase subunit type 1 TsaE [Cytophagales bacterium]|nr:MAG: tRNA (adenosine(37)-N6)-threonylcarbamoyltransferase complex ATPase subunit type 1 TsaE [Cytophagales bacterium]
MLEFTCQSLDELPAIAEKMIIFGEEKKIWLFEGEMGAGKTTLIKALCKVFGVLNTVQSPTFSLVNEYHTTKNQTLYHFDFYRLKHWHEALDMGIEEYLDSNCLCLIEWAEKITPLLPEDYLKITIKNIENIRIFTLTKAPLSAIP